MRSKSKFDRHFQAVLLAASASLTMVPSAVQARQAGAQFTYDIPAKDLGTALTDLARQSKREIYFDSDITRGKRAPHLSGSMTVKQALARLLEGSGLTYRTTSSGSIVIQAVKPGAGTTPAAAQDLPEEETTLVVTGTRIPGAIPASPVLTLTRDDIERSGYSQVGDLVRSLPQNFNGGQNPGVQRGNNADNNNVTGATTLNLRGLGPAATLVLLNGNRMAADGATQAPDVSVIPLGAIKRIDVVTDGASALYGSDAVAGVVNFILRDDFEGAEGSARLGGATQGGGFEQTYGLLLGKNWVDGHILLSGEYSQQDSVAADQRDFTSAAPPIVTLIPETKRKTVLLNFKQQITDWMSVKLDGIYNRRDGKLVQQFASAGDAYFQTQKQKWYQIDPGIEFHLPHRWYISVDGSLSKSVTDTPYVASSGTTSRGNGFRNASKSVQLTTGGPLFKLPSGEVKIAAGAAFRNERLSQYRYGVIDRDIWSLFGEMSVPVVNRSPDRTGLVALDLSASLRSEHYDSFGTTTTPKFGLRYIPLNGLTIRGTWGKSFHAPSLYQLAVPGSAQLYDARVVGGTSGTFLFEYGGNPDLKPEKATSWTAGAEWTPDTAPSFKLSATYFNTKYDDRIVVPITVATQALSDPVYSQFITWNPSGQQVQDSIDRLGTFWSTIPGPFDPASVVAIGHDLLANASSQTLHGVDLSLSNRFIVQDGSLDAFLNGTWMRLRQKTISDAPTVDLSGRIFGPSEYRLRTGLSWSDNGLTVTGIVNYVSGETDTAVTPQASIASWTTIDLSVNYTIPQKSGVFSGVEASLAITNLLDQDPPYAAGAGITSEGIYYDSTNVSPMGRFISATLKKRL